MQLKKTLLIFIFVIVSFLIFDLNIKAYEFTNNAKIYTEETIYNDFSKIENFDINKYSNIYCSNNNTFLYCYAITPESSQILNKNGDKLEFVNPSEDCVFYRLVYQFSFLGTHDFLSCNSNTIFFNQDVNNIYSNFDFPFYNESENEKVSVLNFSSYITSDEKEDEDIENKEDEDIENKEDEDIEIESDINIKATEVLNLIINKARNIYEVLINNQLLLFLICIPLVYLGFVFLYKIFKR